MTADQLRREIRRELHVARCRDGDQSPERYGEDAALLDERMTAAGHPPAQPTGWGVRPARLRGVQNPGLAAFRLLGGAIDNAADPECQLEDWERV